ncbi:TPA: heavy metal translocating P-type ATPase, partial [Vibrio cholerae O1]
TPAFVADLHGQPLPDAANGWAETGDTLVALGDASGWLAFFRLGDEIRPQAAELIARLHAAGREVILLSGDALPVAR